ncbi:hypothetical protein RB195_025560 [Necator americanus]|uniref:Uncharacterized protein n=1 Tax=Necator americanus TaxID=51031 RepID=A0ABR1ESW0_NECAM
MNKTLISLGKPYYPDVLTDSKRRLFERLVECMALEQYVDDTESCLYMSKDDKEKYTMTERHVCETLVNMIRIW